MQFIPRRIIQRIQPSTPEERNIPLLYVEIMFASVLAVAGTFNGAYVLRLGGSNELIGLMSSIPALITATLCVPFAQILERKTRLMPYIVGSLLLSRGGYLLISLLPLLLHRSLPELTVSILIAATIPAVFFSTAWSPLLSDVVPPRMRATVLSWRSILSSVTIAPLIYLAGLWLNKASFPSNYQWMYAVGFLAGGCSILLVSRLGLPERDETAASHTATPREPLLPSLRNLMRRDTGFGRIIANTLFYDFGAWMIAPLYIILFVRQLGASDGWLGLNGTLANVGVILGYWLWRQIIRRLGEARALRISLPMATVYPLLVAAFPNLTFILFAGFLINVINPGVSLSHSVIFLGLLPEGKKYTSTALYNSVMNIGAFVAPLIGVALSNVIGIIPTLLLGGAMRVLGAGMFYLFPVQIPPAEETLGASTSAQ